MSLSSSHHGKHSNAYVGEPWPILVVSLPSDSERRSRIGSQLRDLSLPFTFVDAIDGRTGLSQDNFALVDQDGARKNIGRALTSPEIGCALSHLKVYRLILDQGLEGAIVLEDDAVLLPDFRTFIDCRGYLEAPLLQLEYAGTRVFPGRGRSALPHYRTARVATQSHLTVAYSINAFAARHLLEVALPLSGPADWPCDTIKVGHKVLIPKLVRHPEGNDDQSHIAASRNLARAQGESRGGFLTEGYWRMWWRKLLSVRIA